MPAVTPFSIASPCVWPLPGRSFEHALLRAECGGALEPGRATWTVTGNAVVLEFPPGSQGPKGAELVAAWPPLDRPPWLGHQVNRVAVLADGGILVEFGDPVRDPARLFADPRLAGVPLPVEGGDVRDAIDADTGEIVTRHDASIEYARSLGRSVQLVAYDRLYLVAFAGNSGEGGAAATRVEDLRAEATMGWVGRGATLARGPPSVEWETVAEMCGSGSASDPGDTVATAAASAQAAPPPPTVSFLDRDPAARQIAERMVSLGLPGGPLGATVAELTGSRERMVVRPVAPGGARWSRTDVATVIAVPAGPVHPCSLYAEVEADLGGWEGGRERGIPTVLLVGETASFAIGPTVGRR